MRKDYEYVNMATCMCLETTDKGSKYLHSLLDEEIEQTPWDDDKTPDFWKNEVLLLTDSEYIQVHGGLKEMYEQYKVQYKEYCDNYETNLTYEQWCELWTQGLLGVKKVIWD